MIVCYPHSKALLKILNNQLAKPSTKYLFNIIPQQAHNKLMNKILLVSQKDLQLTIRQILSHFLNMAQLKNSSHIVISLLTKFIDFLKFYQKIISNKSQSNPQTQNTKTQQLNNEKNPKEQQKAISSVKKINRNEVQKLLINSTSQHLISQILQQIIDIILLIQNKSKSNDQQTYLRIIQTTFSIIDVQFIQYMSFSLLTKIYSISFQCCHVNNVIQNISVSCLFSLTQTLFSLNSKQMQSQQILQNWLQFLFRNKKFLWIKDSSLNGLIWDLTITGIKSQQQTSLDSFSSKQSNVHLLNIMYKISAQKAFNSKSIAQKLLQNKQNKKNINNEVSISFRNDSISQFIRFYKAFVILSFQYSLINLQQNKQEVVPFRDNVRLFNIIYELQRNWRMYIFLQGVFYLIDKYPECSVNQQKGYILLEVVSKIAQQLCLGNQKISCQWVNQKSFLNKFYASDLWTVNDGDFVKIIRNSLISLRKKFQYMKNKQDESWTKISQNEKSMLTQNISSQRSDQGSKNSNVSTVRKRWQKFIKCIIKVIRYLSSISILSETDQQPVRKIILQLQHWFLICPSIKIKNLILQQLLITTSTLTTKQQAIKISQCIQIGSNLIYGYYDLLDSIGLSIIMKMMAGIKASRQEGKEFQELQQVFNMSEKLYLEQKIVKNSKQFSVTIQAFVQCSNSLVADLQQPQHPMKVPTPGKNPSQRYYKMIQYLLQKLNIVILQNCNYLFDEWSFLTGFWMSFCSSKNNQIQCRTIIYVGEVIQKLLQVFKQRQQEVVSIYLQLSTKCTSKKDIKIQYQIIAQIKNYLPLVQNQKALMETFKVIKIFQNQLNTNKNQKQFNSSAIAQQKKFMNQLSQLQQAFVKEGIYRIKNLFNLEQIIEGIQVLGNEKNQQYKILTLLWTVADHLKALNNVYQNSNQQLKDEYQKLWRRIFQKIDNLSTKSHNAQTKQSSIHTFTQIIAESSPLIKDEILIELYEKIFIESLFISLMQNHSRLQQYGTIDVSLKVDMIKAAIKNYFKLTKKFTLQNIFKKPQQKVKFTLQKVINYLKSINSQNKKNVIPVEMMYEYVVFAEKLIDNVNIEQKYIDKEDILMIIKELQNMEKNSDQSTILWKKKYYPHFIQVKTNIQKLQKKEENINNKQQKNEQK